MANKEQCLRCKGYKPTSNLCTIKWMQPSFDDSKCNQYHDGVTTALNTESCKKQEDQSSEIFHTEEENFNQIKKRGMSSRGKSLHVRGKAFSYKENDDELNEPPSKRAIEIPENLVRIVGTLFIILVVLSLGYGGFYYIKNKKKQEIEDIVWKARTELALFTSDKTIEYLRLYKTEYNDGYLNLFFLRNLSRYNNVEQVTDSTMIDDIVSFVSINPSIWDSVCTVLEKAAVDLSIIYSDVEVAKGQGMEPPKITIPHAELRNRLLSDTQRTRGLDLFVKRKAKEVQYYAYYHFKNDIFFEVDSVDICDHYVSLHLTYDDSKTQLGKSFLDTTFVNPHFTDPVGEMGSILDGMLSICLRDNKGIAFIYTGKKKHEAKCIKWNAEKTKEIAKEQSRHLPVKGRKTNQVKTVVTRVRQDKQ